MNRNENEDSGYFRTGRVNGGKDGDSHDSPKSHSDPTDSSFEEPPLRVRPLFFSRCRRASMALMAGLLLTLFQIGVILMVTPAGKGDAASFQGRLDTLFQHDSFWFEDIMVRGYASPVPPSPVKSYEISNVAFFPGYPLLAGFLQEQWSLPPRAALLITAWLSAWLFWSYAVLFLMRWQAPRIAAVGVLAVIVAHPAALFMVAAYSESLFLAMLVGFLFWSSREGKFSALIAAVHGFGMTATRIVGLPCSLASGGGGRVGGGRLQRLERRASISLMAALGGVLFFVFCQARFGSWDFYAQTQKAGWGVVPNFLAPFYWGNYTRFTPDWTAPRELSQFSMGFTLVMAVCLAVLEVWAKWQAAVRQGASGIRVRLPFYFCALVIFYISAAGVASVGFQSMIRYHFCTWALAILAVAHLLATVPPKGPLMRGVLLFLGALLVGAGWWLQLAYARIFTQGGWFA